MFRKSFCTLLLLISGLLTGCGSDSGGAAYLFEDGIVTYSVEAKTLTSTVGTSPTSTDENSVEVTLSNTPNPKGIRKSPYTVSNVVLKYTKMDKADFVLNDYPNMSPTMSSGGTVTLPFTIATSVIKEQLLSKGFTAGVSWNFYVTGTFTVKEDYSNKTTTYQVQLGTVQFI